MSASSKDQEIPAKAFSDDTSVEPYDVKRNLVAGRRKGARTKLANAVMVDTLAAWEKHGRIALDRLAVLEPDKFTTFIAKVLPKEIKVEHTTATEDMSDERLADLIDFADQMVTLKAKGAVIIEGHAVELLNNTAAEPFNHENMHLNADKTKGGRGAVVSGSLLQEKVESTIAATKPINPPTALKNTAAEKSERPKIPSPFPPYRPKSENYTTIKNTAAGNSKLDPDSLF